MPRPTRAMRPGPAIPGITHREFESTVLKALPPVVLDFFAPWCGPCRALDPLLEQLERTFERKLRIHKVDVDQEPLLAEKLGISSVPTLVLFRNGHERSRTVGAISWRRLCFSVSMLLDQGEPDQGERPLVP